MITLRKNQVEPISKEMLIDEAHLYSREADSMLGAFLEDSEISHVLGITATPIKFQSNTDANVSLNW